MKKLISMPIMANLPELTAFLQKRMTRTARILSDRDCFTGDVKDAVTGLLDEMRIPYTMGDAGNDMDAPDVCICVGFHGVRSRKESDYGTRRRCFLPVIAPGTLHSLHLIAHGMELCADRRLSGRERAAAITATAQAIRAVKDDSPIDLAVIELAKAAKGRTGTIHALATALGHTHAEDADAYDAYHGDAHAAASCLAAMQVLPGASSSALAEIARSCGLSQQGAGDDVSAAALTGWFRGQCAAIQLPERYTHIPQRDVYTLANLAAEDAPGLDRFRAYDLLMGMIQPEDRTRDAARLVDMQRAFFRRNATLDMRFRKDALKRLQRVIRRREGDIHAALKADLGKSADESYLCETGMVLSELTHMLRHMDGYARVKYVWSPMAQFPSVSSIRKHPLGVSLIMSPWNYPFLLTIDPLIGAIAAGCTAIVKPSAYAPATSGIIRDIVAECFPQEHVAVIEGGRAENQALLDQRFDKIFFTGGGAVGREVLRKAALHLTPVTLELGGKSPVVVDDTADIAVTARRIAFGKLLNAGQTCVAPDYVLVHKDRHDALIDALCAEFTRQATDNALTNPDYPHIVNRKHFDRVMGLIDRDAVCCGGQGDPETRRIQPTIMKATAESAAMQEEIFGPVLPVIPVESLDEAIDFIRDRDTPLAAYLFTQSRANQKRFLREVPFGGGCVNDTIIHLASSRLPFGGLGASGTGAYHGKFSFDCFSHHCGVVDKGVWLDLPMRYAPRTEKTMKSVRFFMK